MPNFDDPRGYYKHGTMDQVDQVAIVKLAGDDDEIPFWNYTSISLDPGSLGASPGHHGGSRGLRGEAGGGTPGGTPGETGDNCNRHAFPPRIDLTFVIAAGGTIGILITIYILYRAYLLLSLVYCRNRSTVCQCLDFVGGEEDGCFERRQPGRTAAAAGGTNIAGRPVSPNTIYIIDSCRETRGRSRGTGLGVPGMAGVLARMAAHRKGETPPPPYDSPPPYHVAIKMGAVPDIVVSDPIVI